MCDFRLERYIADLHKLGGNKHEVFNLYFTSYTGNWNLIESDQAQYGVLEKDSKYA